MNTPCKSQAIAVKSENPGTPFSLPGSPFLQRLGYGTGIHVFRFERPPDASGKAQSPWAAKCLTKFQNTKAGKKEISKRLLAEANILRSLNHPNIVGFRALKTFEDGRASLLMEECTISLGDMLEERFEQKLGPLPAAQIKKMCIDICKALDYLHNEAHLLHADIKSPNILIKKDFEICKLCDFGVSVPLNADGYIDVVKNPDAQYIGTGLWCAPEVDSDDIDNISFKADIFSFGLVIYECITCAPPYIDSNESSNDSSVNSESGDDSKVLTWTRPRLPIDDRLDDKYDTLIEIFNICTNESPKDRPNAKSLLDSYLQK